MTSPYLPIAETEIKNSVRHVHVVRANHPDWDDPIVLDVITCTVTFDEDAFPRVSASLAIKIPDDSAVLDLLDPRLRVQIEIDAGYRYAGGVLDVHPFVVLDLRERVVQRPQEQVVLSAQGYECRLLDTCVLTPVTYDASDDAGAVLAARLAYHAPGAATAVNRLAAKTFLEGTDEIDEEVGAVPADLQDDIADRADAVWYYDGLSQWVIESNPTIAGRTTHWLSVGNGGTLTATESSLNRERFYNTVVVKHTWDGGSAVGWAAVTSGDYAVASVGRKAKVIERDYKGSANTAKAAARAMVTRGVSRGRQVSVESGAAAYWLRPGHTVQIQLPTGEAERHLVARVDFDLPSGSMHVTTRLPEDVTITEGE